MLGTNGAALCGGVGRHVGCLVSRCWAFAGVSGGEFADGVEKMLWEWVEASIKTREPRRGALTSRLEVPSGSLPDGWWMLCAVSSSRTANPARQLPTKYRHSRRR